MSRPLLPGFAAVVLLSFATTAAEAHHGWSWTAEEEWFELTGTLTELYIGQPHATLAITDGSEEWMVDLAPLSATLAAGFDDSVVSVGQEVTVIGHRATDPEWMAMKAVRVVAPSGTYDVYPQFAADYDAAQ